MVRKEILSLLDLRRSKKSRCRGAGQGRTDRRTRSPQPYPAPKRGDLLEHLPASGPGSGLPSVICPAQTPGHVLLAFFIPFFCVGFFFASKPSALQTLLAQPHTITTRLSRAVRFSENSQVPIKSKSQPHNSLSNLCVSKRTTQRSPR